MADFFFYGTLCHAPLLARVLGRTPPVQAARLADHAVYWARGRSFPMIVAEAGAVAEGVLVAGLSPDDVARLNYYEGGFSYRPRTLEVRAGGISTPALVYLPDPGQWEPGARWRLADWQARWGAVVTEAAGDFMAAYGQRSAAEQLARYDSLLIRAASRLRAVASPAPTRLRRTTRPGDIDVTARREPYAKFFAVEEYDLSCRRFDGAMGPEVTRAALVSADAATVLPYDSLRDRVMLVEQFRTGPFARGDTQPWVLEAIAGRVDPGETPEAAIRREAREEAALDLQKLMPVAGYYPSPGAKTEFVFSFVALAALPDRAGGVGGLEAEAEDIRAHVITFDDLMALIASGEVANGPLILSALWLQRERPRLRAEAGAGG